MATRSLPRDPDQLTIACATRFARAHRQWLADPAGGEADLLRFNTASPTAAGAAENPGGTAAWIRRWREFEKTRRAPAVRMTWEDRRLPGFGVTALPQRVEVRGADAIARLAGQTTRWETLLDRTSRILTVGGDQPALHRAAADTSATWEPWDDDEFDRLLAVCRWALANPTTGLRAREIAVPGVDTKWIETRTRVVETLLDAARTRAEGTAAGLGLRGPEIRVRMRVLDPDLVLPLRDVESPVEQLATLWPTSEGPRHLVVVENLTTFLALPDLPDTVAIFGRGFAVDAVAALPWALRARIAYWGDLDSHGFTILDRLRRHAPRAISVLMDTETLDTWREYAVLDPSPTRTAPSRLTPGELDALEALTIGGDLRLEQERVPWDWALPRLRRALLPGR
ncbi:Wadjet anti-phage system protein JetD domain-containing protein [Dietzia sp. PP-33]|uniref:Wadjet anti-phage system protein JetD domain-containing protein n=1 Tax=Dietzia sp. PP-33 TaxID=2957500 RepID=UPI0029A03BF0|nr:Wadjet anti-phage system protein JetD domain-containing protein [Dietzia sp. PP-33]MDX2357314.1 DUF2220 family protein [Dietzia sp. PP-33]